METTNTNTTSNTTPRIPRIGPTVWENPKVRAQLLARARLVSDRLIAIAAATRARIAAIDFELDELPEQAD
jgi:hypothetical protein